MRCGDIGATPTVAPLIYVRRGYYRTAIKQPFKGSQRCNVVVNFCIVSALALMRTQLRTKRGCPIARTDLPRCYQRVGKRQYLRMPSLAKFRRVRCKPVLRTKAAIRLRR